MIGVSQAISAVKTIGGAGKAAKTAKGVGAASIAFDAFNVATGVADYKAAREEGDSQAVSVAKAVGSFMLYEALGGYGIAITAIQAGGTLLGASSEHTTKQMGAAYGSVGKLGSGYFDMSRAGYTMRQRSLNAIRNNGTAIQSAIGNEARTYFRSTT